MKHQSSLYALAALSPGNMLALLTFKVGEQTYGLPVTNVFRIIEMVTITRLPNTSDAVQGIINVQGKVVPVMELRHRFGLSGQLYGLHTPIILADIIGAGQMLGLIVDAVEDVVQVPYERLEITERFTPPELAGRMAAQVAHLVGVAKIERQMIPVLEVRALLTQTEQTELSRALGNDITLETVNNN